jgi:hypothetical protein
MMEGQGTGKNISFPMGKSQAKMKKSAANIVKKFITNSR